RRWQRPSVRRCRPPAGGSSGSKYGSVCPARAGGKGIAHHRSDDTRVSTTPRRSHASHTATAAVALHRLCAARSDAVVRGKRLWKQQERRLAVSVFLGLKWKVVTPKLTSAGLAKHAIRPALAQTFVPVFPVDATPRDKASELLRAAAEVEHQFIIQYLYAYY